VWLRERRHVSGTLHGAIEISRGLDLGPAAAALVALDGTLHAFNVRSATFLDIETTGLSLGTGTVAFLIGLGFFDANDFVVRQLFVDRLENEPAVLASLLEVLAERPHLVTFNGKTFDVPVLKARLGLARMPPGIDAACHLDLLHSARRLYKRRIGDCSLDSCERSVLLYHREGDVPSELIPEIYVEYLRTGRPGRLTDVFHHNLIDVVSMAALAGHMASLVEAGDHDLDDLVSLARVQRRFGEEDEAAALWGRTSSSPSSEHRIESRLELALMARRRSDHALERELLEKLLEDDPDHALAHLMLAKLHEHRLKDPAQALRHARLAEEAEGFEASARRIARLERKLGGISL
jgi:uncharacterized protein YprB with RNaseH-like and TPR domain